MILKKLSCCAAAALTLLLPPGSTAGNGALPDSSNASGVAKSGSKAISLANPILFVTQVPTPTDQFASRTSTFANHLGGIGSVLRGGDLMIQYPNGTLRNLTQEAGYGQSGQQGANAIAVREPHVHWSGTKAIFSMVVGAPTAQYQVTNHFWQLYEITGLAQGNTGNTAVITKVAGQSATHNNVSPIYDTNDNILFTSDAPRDGQAHLYPQLDEYESTATITGLWRLDKTTGKLKILNHTPSGLFSPFIDSFGRVIFTRWDHLQRDQQADGAPGNGYVPQMFASEAANAGTVANNEVFPESRLGGTSAAYGTVAGYTFNLFQPWEMNQDGTSELTLNHLGRHELSYNYIGESFTSDPALTYLNTLPIANTRNIRGDGGLFQIKEDPTVPGRYYAIYTPEFGTMTSGNVIRFNASPNLNAEQIAMVDASPPDTTGNGVPGGRIRNPLPLTSGALLAVHSASTVVQAGIQFRIKELIPGGNGMLAPGQSLTGGINKTLSWWSPDTLQTYSGPLWEFEPVEVVARARPQPRVAGVADIEKQVLNEESVDEAALRAWLKSKDLALIITRNHTSRDRGDKQQPYNLRVPGASGAQTLGNTGKIYDIAHYQIMQADQVRGYQGRSGRRPIGKPMTTTFNPTTTGPAGSVPIALDGSSAAFVPASKALAWQTTDAAGEPIVRERVWVTLQPGEIRTCAGCHGENSRNQANALPPVNKPAALRALMQHWKSIAPTAAPLAFDIDGNGSCDASTDATLTFRYMSGLRGDALVQGIPFASGASRKSPADIAAYLSSLGLALDIDGDGLINPLTDGLLFWRYAVVMPGNLLTTSVRAPLATPGTRTDAAIQTYLNSKCVLPP
jgi:Hydrazine synthase alpha subunit middle domain